MNDFQPDMQKAPEFASWFESVLRSLWDEKCDTIGIVARSGNMVYTHYFRCDLAEDKAVLAYHIMKDALIDEIGANGREIKAAWENLENQPPQEGDQYDR